MAASPGEIIKSISNIFTSERDARKNFFLHNFLNLFLCILILKYIFPNILKMVKVHSGVF